MKKLPLILNFYKVGLYWKQTLSRLFILKYVTQGLRIQGSTDCDGRFNWLVFLLELLLFLLLLYLHNWIDLNNFP